MYELVNEWAHSEDDDELYNIARAVEDTIILNNALITWMWRFLSSECFPCINECIPEIYVGDFDNIIKADDMVAAVETQNA